MNLLRDHTSQDYNLVRDRIREIIEEVPPRRDQWIFRVQVSTKRVWLSRSKMEQFAGGSAAPQPTATPTATPLPTITPTPTPSATPTPQFGFGTGPRPVSQGIGAAGGELRIAQAPTATPTPAMWDDAGIQMWTAGLLVHAAFHVDLYDKLTDFSTCEAELQALERQRDALRRMKDSLAARAPVSAPSMLAYLQGFIVEANCAAEPPEHVVP